MAVTSNDIIAIQKAVLRTSNSISAALIADRINTNQLTVDQYISSLIGQASTSTKIALLVSSYVEGLVPTSARVDSLTAFAAQQYNAAPAGTDALLYAYQALGAAFSDTTQFAAKVSGLTVEQLITQTYLDSLGITPGAPQLTHFTGQYNYFRTLYINAGISTAVAEMQAKGAVVGQIIYYGAIQPGTNFYTKSNNWLYNAGAGSAAYGVPL